MALNGIALGNAIAAQMGVTEPTAVESWQKFGTAIVAYFTTNAVVAVASVSGVTSGSAVSGPGTGTIS
jgi:hypothetical protein